MSQGGTLNRGIFPPGSVIETVTGNTGGPVGPNGANNIFIIGSGNINVAGNPATFTETITLVGTTNHAVQVGNAGGSLTSLTVGTNGQVLLGSTGANPVFANLTSSDNSITFTTGPGSLGLTVTGGTTVGKTITGDTGGALSPTAGNWNIVGTAAQGISSSGAGSTLTFTIANATTTQKGVVALATNAEAIAGTDTTKAITSDDLKAKLGTQTNHSLLVGAGTSAAITALGVATNGQLPIGSTGADPVLATLTAGTGIAITNGAGSISVATSGSIATTYNEDSGSATPALGILNIVGLAGRNITTSGATNVVSIAVSGTTNHSIQLGNSNGSLTSLGVATNGQLPIGSTGADPVLATLTAGTGISITNGAGSITIASSGTFTLNYTNVTTSPYVVLTTDDYLSVDTSAIAITIQLPNAPSTGRSFVIKDRTGAAFTRNITVTTVGGAVNIDGATTYTMNTNFAAINVLFNGTSYEVY